MRPTFLAAVAAFALVAGSTLTAAGTEAIDRAADLFDQYAPSEPDTPLEQLIEASEPDAMPNPALIEELAPEVIERAQADNPGGADDFGDFAADAPAADAPATPPVSTPDGAPVEVAPPVDASVSPTVASPAEIVVPSGWISFEKLGVSFAVPPDFAIKMDEEDEFLVANTEMDTPHGCAIMGQYDRAANPMEDLPPGAVPENLPDRDLGFGLTFGVGRFSAELDGNTLRAMAVFSRQPFKEKDHFQVAVSCANTTPEEADALMMGVLGSLHLIAMPDLPVPEADQPRLGGLVTGAPPVGWTIYRSNEVEWTLIEPSFQAAVGFTTGSEALSALQDLAPAERFRTFEVAPDIYREALFGEEGWMLSGKMAPDDPERGVYNGGLVGPISYFFANRCTPSGDALVVSVSAQQSWIEAGNSIDPFLSTVALHWPEGGSTCSEPVAAAIAAATQPGMDDLASETPGNEEAVVSPSVPVASAPSAEDPLFVDIEPDVVTAEGSVSWGSYTDPRFGTTVSYPTELFIVQSTTEDQSGRKFAIADGEAEFTVGGTLLDEAVTVDDLMRQMVSSPEIDVLTGMTRLNDSSFRLDGLHQNQHVVQIVALGNGIDMAMFAAHFSEQYADLIDRIAASFEVLEPQTRQPSAIAAPQGADPAIELAFWDAVKDSTDPADFQAYLDQFPNGAFAALARIRINRLADDQTASSTPNVPAASDYAAEHVWETYFNDRYGTVIDYPADIFVPQPPPDNNDGRQFSSRDGQSAFYVYAQYNAMGQSLQELYDADLSMTGQTVTYSTISDGWFVVSGLRNDEIFYRKTILTPDDLLRSFEISYQRNLKDTFDPVVERMANSFGGEDVSIGGDGNLGGLGPSGIYITDWGDGQSTDIQFQTAADGSVQGDYDDGTPGDSHVIGQISGTAFTGQWIEPSSAKRCSDGSYWGKLELNFSADFSTLDGLWSYCEEAPDRRIWGELSSGDSPVSPQDVGSSAPEPPVALGPLSTPARGTAERSAIIDAARGPVVSDIGQTVIFVVSVLKSDGHWAYLQATPVQPNGSALDWNQTNFAADWQADVMSDTVMVLLSKDGGDWHVVDHVVGPTDVYWYSWIDQYQLPEALFHD